MKIPKNFMRLQKKSTAKLYSVLFNGTALPSNNPLRFRKNILEKIL